MPKAKDDESTEEVEGPTPTAILAETDEQGTMIPSCDETGLVTGYYTTTPKGKATLLALPRSVRLETAYTIGADIDANKAKSPYADLVEQ